MTDASHPEQPPLRGLLVAATLSLVAGTVLTATLRPARLEVSSGPAGFFGRDSGPLQWLVDGVAAPTPVLRVAVDEGATGAAAPRPGGGWVVALHEGRLLALRADGTVETERAVPRSSRAVLGTGADRFAVPGGGGELTLVDLGGGPTLRAPAQSGWIWVAAAAPDGGRLLTASWDGAVVLRGGDGEPLRTLVGHRGSVKEAVFSPDGARVATVGNDGIVRVWSREGDPAAVLDVGGGGAHRCGFTGDGGGIVVVPADGRTPTFHPLPGGDPRPIPVRGVVVCTTPAPDGIVLGLSRGEVIPWRTGDGPPPPARPAHRGSVGAMAWIPGRDGWLATAGGDGALRLSDAHGRERAVLLGMARHARQIVPAVDGAALLVVFKTDQGVPPLRVDLGTLPR